MPASCPNIVVLISHDTGRHFGCYGIEALDTPNIDALAGQGLRLNRMYSTCSVCSPARTSLFTGRYPQRNGMMGLTHEPWNWRMNPGQKHLSHLLHGAGYQTALIGHRHETMDAARDCKFDIDRAYMNESGWYTTAAEVARETETYLENDRDPSRPFYLQLGFFETHRRYSHGQVGPHSPRGVFVPPFIEPDEAAREDFAMLQGSLKSLDNAVGRILGKLDELGLAENTLVVQTVDHGLDVPGAKHTLLARGLEIATILRMGGRIAPGSTSDALLSNVDILPTILELAGLETLDDLDGRSFAGLTRGEPVGRDAVFSESTSSANSANGRSVITDRYHLIWNFSSGRRPRRPARIGPNPPSGPRPAVSLFDLREDPEELTDLAADPERAPVKQELISRLRAWMEDVDDPVLKGPVVEPFYARAMGEIGIDWPLPWEKA